MTRLYPARVRRYNLRRPVVSKVGAVDSCFSFKPNCFQNVSDASVLRPELTALQAEVSPVRNPE
jgi:hypothetical protein